MIDNSKLHTFEIYKKCLKEPFKKHKIIIHILENTDGSRKLVPINYCDDSSQCKLCEDCKNALEKEYLENLYQLDLG